MPLCPHCSQEIKEGARKCPHCKSYLDPELAAQRRAEEGPPAKDESEGGFAHLVTAFIELVFAGLTLILGAIIGILTIAFATWAAFKAFAWNNRYKEITGRNSACAIAGGILSAVAALLASIFTWIVVRRDGFY
jgi:hypothetical protein